MVRGSDLRSDFRLEDRRGGGSSLGLCMHHIAVLQAATVLVAMASRKK